MIVEATLQNDLGQQIAVANIVYDPATDKLPEVVRYQGDNYLLEHNPAGNINTENPPIYQLTTTFNVL